MIKLNKFAFALMIVLLSAITFGCSGSTETPQKAPQETTAAVSEGEKVTVPEERPVLIGKVKEIVGNEVTIYKAEIVQNQDAPKQGPEKQPQDQKSESQTNQGQNPQNRGVRMKFTEETETFIIPVGTPIVTMQRGSQEATEVGLTEIKKDSIIRIWKKDDAVSFVQVSGMRDRQGGGGQGHGNGTGMGGNRQVMGGNN